MPHAANPVDGIQDYFESDVPGTNATEGPGR